jgi:two-component sensor histidine kinase
MKKYAYAYNEQDAQPSAEALKQNIFEEIPTPLAIINSGLDILFANTAFCVSVPPPDQQPPSRFRCKACEYGPCNIPLPLDAAFVKHRENGGAVTHFDYAPGQAMQAFLRISNLHNPGAYLLAVDNGPETLRPKHLQEGSFPQLSHKISNALQMAKTLAARTAHHSATLEVFLKTYEGRLSAFAEAQAEAARNHWQCVSLETILLQTASLPGFGKDRIKIHPGPAVELPAQEALSLRLALHELLTNALKHGALSQGAGLVEISWKASVSQESRIALLWKESGGPTLMQPKKRGFGIELLETVLPFDLHGKVRLRFEPQGFRCEVEFALPEGGRIGWS